MTSPCHRFLVITGTVAAVAIGKAGAKNAAILAIQILATTDSSLAAALAADREEMGVKVRAANEQLQQR